MGYSEVTWGCPEEPSAQDYEPSDGTISQEKDEYNENARFGFDINSKLIYGPDTPDLMSYGSPNWPSAFTYTHIRACLINPCKTGTLSLAQMAGEPAILVSGIVTPTHGTGNLESVFAVDSSVSVSVPDPGTYTIRFEGSAGQMLASHSFEPGYVVASNAGNANNGTGDVGYSSLLLPWNANTTRIVLLHDTQQLDMRSASNNAPTVSVTSPNGGESFTGSNATLTWSATDLDGDPIEYVVEYSADAGASWQTLAPLWLSTTFPLNLDVMAGTDRGLLRVLASDGFHTTQDQSDGTFSVAKHAPHASIQTPENDSLYVGGQLIILEGDGYDNEDGQLSGAALSWSSDLDGALGDGDSLAVNASTLAEGAHTITLTAQDSDGQTQQYRDHRSGLSRPPRIAHRPIGTADLAALHSHGGRRTDCLARFLDPEQR